MKRFGWKLGRGAVYFVWALVASQVWARTDSTFALIVGGVGLLFLGLWFLSGIGAFLGLLFGGSPGSTSQSSYNYSPAYNRDGSLRSQYPQGHR